MAMTMKVAMHERHMVRKYLDKPIPADIVETLNDRIRKLNNDHGIEMKLITEDKSAFSTVVRLILAKGVRNYIILAGKEADDLSEKLGYASADIMLFAQTLGLNTWWVGGTFNRGIQSQVSPDDKVIGYIDEQIFCRSVLRFAVNTLCINKELRADRREMCHRDMCRQVGSWLSIKEDRRRSRLCLNPR